MKINNSQNRSNSVAISAGAGSGKTHTLTNLLLLMLFNDIPINEVLSVTFTNKAAGEIKDRLLKRIEKIIEGSDESIEEIKTSLKVSGKALTEKAKYLRYDLIRHFSSLRIGTIDSFFTSIIKQFPHETNTGLELNIIDDSERKVLFNEALERFYKNINSNQRLFRRVYEYLNEKNKKGFRTKWLFEDVYNSFNPYFFKLINSELYNPELPQKAEEKLIKIKNYIQGKEFEELMKKTIDLIERYLLFDNVSNEGNVKKLLNKLKSFFPTKDIYKLKAISIFEPRDPTEKNYIHKIPEIWPEEGNTIISYLRKIRKAIAEYIRATIDYQFFRELEIYMLIKDEYSDLKSKTGVIDFDDIELIAYQFLKNLNHFDYFSYRMDTSIRHILIDEFQDTSDIQWKAIEPLASEAIKTGGSLIYVGDVKQSIYQWRGGRPALFKEVKKRYNLAEKVLEINYRSAPIILDFINGIFLDIKNRFPDFEYEAQKLPPKSKDNNREDGYIYIKAIKDKGEIVDQVVEKIKSLHEKGVDYADIAVLCEKNSEIEEIELLLKRNNISFVGSGKRSLLDDYAAIDIMNILRFLSDPEAEIHILSVLRSPMFRVKYDVLEKIKKKDEKISLKSISMYEPITAETLENLLKYSRYLSVSKLLLKLFEDLAIFETYPSSRDTILDLYELSYNFESSKAETSLPDFIEYLEKSGKDIKSKTASIEGVQLSTIHSAKGLEYHTVIIPYLTKKQSYGLEGKYNFKEKENGDISGFVKTSKDYQNFYSDDDFEEMKTRIKKNYEIENINLLYVALTRARENLIVLPHLDNKSIGGLFISSLYPAVDFKKDPPREYEIGKIVPSKEVKKSTPVWNYLSIDKSKIEKFSVLAQPRKELEIEGDLFSRRLSLLKGLTVHRIISYVNRLPITDEKFGLLLERALFYEGRRFTKLEREQVRPEAEASARRVLEDTRVTRFFSENSYAELSTLGKEYQNLIGRIDRIIIDDNLVEIIDFKTDRIKNEREIPKLAATYKRQIEGYCKTLRDIFPERKVKGYIYFTDGPFEKRIQQVS